MIPLANRQRVPTTAQNLLAARKNDLRRLLDEASSNKTSPKYTKRVHHTTNSGGNVKTREKYNSSIGSITDTIRNTILGGLKEETFRHGEILKVDF